MLEHSPKRIAVRYPIWQLQKLAQQLLPLYAELLHIGEIVSIAYQGTQSYYDDIFQLVPDISSVCPALVFHPAYLGINSCISMSRILPHLCQILNAAALLNNMLYIG